MNRTLSILFRTETRGFHFWAMRFQYFNFPNSLLFRFKLTTQPFSNTLVSKNTLTSVSLNRKWPKNGMQVVHILVFVSCSRQNDQLWSHTTVQIVSIYFQSTNIYLHCATLREFFDILPAKPTSLTLFFEEIRSEKGWVVSLKQNKSEFGEFKISKSHYRIMKNPWF